MEQRDGGRGKFLKSKTNAMMCVKFHALHVGSALSCVPATTTTATTMITITAAAVRRGILQVHYTNTNQRLWLRLRGRQGDRYENPIKAALNVATDDDDDDGDSPSHSLPVSLPLSCVQGKLQAHRTSHSIRTENSKETCKQNKYEIKQRLNFDLPRLDLDVDSCLGWPALPCRFFPPSVQCAALSI